MKKAKLLLICTIIISIASLGSSLMIKAQGTLGPNSVIVSSIGVSVTLKEYVKYQRTLYVMDTELPVFSNNLNLMEAILKELVLVKSLYKAAGSATKKEAAEDAAEELNMRKAFVDISAGGFSQVLRETGITEKEVLENLTLQHATKIILKNKITDEMVRARYEQDLKTDKDTYTVATVRSILIALQPTGKEPRTEEEAYRIASEVYSRLQNGEDFARLAMQYTDEDELRAVGGFLGEIALVSWFPELKGTVSGLNANEYSPPIKSSLGYFLFKVEDKTVKNLGEASEEIVEKMSAEEYYRIMNEELQGQIKSMVIPTVFNVDF